MTFRIHRGFNCIGIVLAALAILAAFTTDAPIAVGLVVASVALYVAARAVGWVLDGFIGTSSKV